MCSKDANELVRVLSPLDFYGHLDLKRYLLDYGTS